VQLLRSTELRAEQLAIKLGWQEEALRSAEACAAQLRADSSAQVVAACCTAAMVALVLQSWDRRMMGTGAS